MWRSPLLLLSPPHLIILLSLRLGVMMGSQSTLDLFLRLKRYHIAGPMRDCKGNEVFAEGNSVGVIGRVRWPGRAVE